MKTSNAELLNEIDLLEEITKKESNDLEVVKYIEKLEGELKSSSFFMVTLKGSFLTFKKRGNAEAFMLKQSATSNCKLICVAFVDAD